MVSSCFSPDSVGTNISSAIRSTGEWLGRFGPVSLDSLNDHARLQTRKDRKYVLAASDLERVFATLPRATRALEIDGQRWFGYESVYFDTAHFDSYRLAARRRPSRFKVRTRTYVEAGLCFAEVKRKDERGRTVKERVQVSTVDDVGVVVRNFAQTFTAVERFSADLLPVLSTSYRRATLVLPEGAVRVTIDADYHCIGPDAGTVGLDQFIVETKTPGAPSLVDRAIWRAGHRPVKISKYATGLASMRPELPANRWAPVLRAHFGRAQHLNQKPVEGESRSEDW